MNDQSATPVAASAGPVALPAPAPKTPPTAIQIIEQEIGGFLRQREQAIANVHAIDGAIQAAKHLLGKLQSEAAKAASLVKTEAGKVETAVEEVATEVKDKVYELVEVDPNKKA